MAEKFQLNHSRGRGVHLLFFYLMIKAGENIRASILLVEDEPNFGAVLRNYLELKNFEVTLCPDGESGYETFMSSAFDLCILDVMIANFNGRGTEPRIHDADAHCC